MNWIPARGSSNVHSTAHDGKNLWVRFVRQEGRTAHYRYDGVPAEAHQEMLKQPVNGSIGQHLHAMIFPHYPGVFVKEEQDGQEVDRGSNQTPGSAS